jgi:hypothetical protein
VQNVQRAHKKLRSYLLTFCIVRAQLLDLGERFMFENFIYAKSTSKKLLPAPKQIDRFDKKCNHFGGSDTCNKKSQAAGFYLYSEIRFGNQYVEVAAENAKRTGAFGVSDTSSPSSVSWRKT